MLESVEKDNKTISEAYKGEELVWKLPTVMISDINLYEGVRNIAFTTYPSGCNVVVIVNRKEVANRISSSTGYFSCRLDTPLQSGDDVTVKMTKSGWRDLRNSYSVY